MNFDDLNLDKLKDKAADLQGSVAQHLMFLTVLCVRHSVQGGANESLDALVADRVGRCVAAGLGPWWWLGCFQDEGKQPVWHSAISASWMTR